MKPINELLGEIEKDNNMDRTNLELEMSKCLTLTTKYLRYHRQYKEVLVKMWTKKNQTELEKQEYYAGRAHSDVYREKPFNLEVKNAVEMKRWIEGDPELASMEETIALTENAIEMIQGMLESLKYRPNHIQTILEIRKFESGS